MRPLPVLTVAASLLLTTSITLAEDPAAKEAPATAADPAVPLGRGFVIEFGTGAAYLGGEMARDVGIGAALMSGELRAGGYVTQHVGILAGVQGGYGVAFDGCGDDCEAYAFQLPLVVQYAFDDRSRGLYLEGGVALLPNYGGATSSDSASDDKQTLMVAGPVDLKLGVGYRLKKTRMEARLGLDAGRFSSVKYASTGVSIDGDVPDRLGAMHFAVGLSVGYNFAL